MPRLFGKDYEWDVVNGQLRLVKPWYISGCAVATPTYDELMAALRMIEDDEPLTMCGTVDEWARKELIRYAHPEGEGRISLGQHGHGVSDPQAGRDAGRSDQCVSGAERDSLARQEGQGAEGALRTCTSCWFDSHTGCIGSDRCGCWKCYGEDEE